MEDEEFIFNNYLYKEDEEIVLPDTYVDEQFLRPSNIIMLDDEKEEEPELPLVMNKLSGHSITRQTPEIKLIKIKRQEPKKEYLFSAANLIFDDDKCDENEDEDEEDFLFKPANLIYEDRLELFNKRREQGIVINSFQNKESEEIIEKKISMDIKPKGFLQSLKAEIKSVLNK